MKEDSASESGSAVYITGRGDGTLCLLFQYNEKHPNLTISKEFMTQDAKSIHIFWFHGFSRHTKEWTIYYFCTHIKGTMPSLLPSIWARSLSDGKLAAQVSLKRRHHGCITEAPYLSSAVLLTGRSYLHRYTNLLMQLSFYLFTFLGVGWGGDQGCTSTWSFQADLLSIGKVSRDCSLLSRTTWMNDALVKSLQDRRPTLILFLMDSAERSKKWLYREIRLSPSQRQYP